MKKARLFALGLVFAFSGSPAGAQSFDAELAPLAADATAKGCDLLDAAHCMYPFPSDHFTEDAPVGSPQSQALGGTGRRIDFEIAGMPRNSEGKPVDPTEWNRNDGFSPGQLGVTYVPGLDLPNTYGAPIEQIGVADIRKSLMRNSPLVVLRVDEDASGNLLGVSRHLAWMEADSNAQILFQPGADTGNQVVFQPTTQPVALLIRPAKNYDEGARYVIALRGLRDANDQPIPADTAFRVCRDSIPTLLPEVQARCDHLDEKVFPVLDAAGIPADESLYLAWDFTVASTNNQIGRLRAMRDEAFAALEPVGGGVDCTQHADGSGCAVPTFTIEEVLESGDPGVEGGIFRQIHGTLTVPSFLVPIDPSPAEDPAIQAIVSQIESQFPSAFSDLFEVVDIAGSASGPPNRQFFDPTDLINPNDPQGAPYGDGLPDSLGTMTRPFMCQIPDVASAADPAKAGVYGHGLLDRRVAITYDGVDDISREHNYMFCALDWFGFATGDLPNVATTLIDLSFFPVIPDSTQQGILNFAYLVRLMAHEDGLADHPAFQDGNGDPLFERSEIFYDGNSQGGILGGAVMAISKDVTRGILGSLGANYSLLLRRSVDFDLYSVPLYVSYTDPLDRNFLFSMMQMVWDRGENNAYAPHIVDNSAFSGPPNIALLHPMFGDHQVTMWSADIMARTMGIPANYEMVEATAAKLTFPQADRHPDVFFGFGLEVLDYADPAHAAGSGLITWDGRFLNNDPNGPDNATYIPPTGNVPPRVGRDPHDDSAKAPYGRCHKTLFLRPNGEITDPTDLEVLKQPILVDGALCP